MIQHEIDGVIYRLHASGELDIQGVNGQRVQLEPVVMFNLSVFLRWPGVRNVLTEAEKERQRCNGEG